LNHFIEIGENLKGKITITLHSGSRKTGHLICTYYMGRADLVDKDLPNGFLHIDSDTGKQYIQDLNYCLDYALENRKKMLEEILKIMKLPVSLMNKMINENHNHAVLKDGLVLHRKGATPADKNQLGVIPGNMRDGVYITEGLGNEEYLSSASHGAGRKYSRSKAKQKLDMDIFKKQMHGIICVCDENILDECPDAYKKIENVIKMQEGIVVKVIDYSKPLII